MSLWSYDPFFRSHPLDRFFGFDDHDDFDTVFLDAMANRKRARDAMNNKKLANHEQAEGTSDSAKKKIESIALINPSLNSMMMHSDLVETNTGFEVHAEVPGIDSDDLEISIIDARTICIKAERKSVKEQESADHKVHSRERSYGVTQRRIRLPANADLEAAKSSLKNGVLTVTIPKKQMEENKSVKKIAIDTN